MYMLSEPRAMLVIWATWYCDTDIKIAQVVHQVDIIIKIVFKLMEYSRESMLAALPMVVRASTVKKSICKLGSWSINAEAVSNLPSRKQHVTIVPVYMKYAVKLVRVVSFSNENSVMTVMKVSFVYTYILHIYK
jgi:hypothetical protein